MSINLLSLPIEIIRQSFSYSSVSDLHILQKTNRLFQKEISENPAFEVYCSRTFNQRYRCPLHLLVSEGKLSRGERYALLQSRLSLIGDLGLEALIPEQPRYEDIDMGPVEATLRTNPRVLCFDTKGRVSLKRWEECSIREQYRLLSGQTLQEAIGQFKRLKDQHVLIHWEQAPIHPLETLRGDLIRVSWLERELENLYMGILSTSYAQEALQNRLRGSWTGSLFQTLLWAHSYFGLKQPVIPEPIPKKHFATRVSGASIHFPRIKIPFLGPEEVHISGSFINNTSFTLEGIKISLYNNVWLGDLTIRWVTSDAANQEIEEDFLQIDTKRQVVSRALEIFLHIGFFNYGSRSMPARPVSGELPIEELLVQIALELFFREPEVDELRIQTTDMIASILLVDYNFHRSGHPELEAEIREAVANARAERRRYPGQGFRVGGGILGSYILKRKDLDPSWIRSFRLGHDGCPVLPIRTPPQFDENSF